jgi:hypothetical protein
MGSNTFYTWENTLPEVILIVEIFIFAMLVEKEVTEEDHN